MISKAAEPRSTTSLAEDTYRQLLADVVSTRLPGGTIVQERRLAARLGVSRSPLRDALGRLEGQGLLVRDGEGVLTVRVVTLQDYLNSLDVRVLLEPPAAALACGAVDRQILAEISAQLARIDADPDPDPEVVWAFDDLLHNTIAVASGNPFIARSVAEMRRYTTMFERQMRVRRIKPGIAEHRDILEALGRGAPEGASAAMARHLALVRDGVLQNY